MGSIKTSEEIEKIEKACSITDDIFSQVICGLRKMKFHTELELAEFIKGETRKRGLRQSFETIVAAGENAAEPHHKPNARKLEGFVVIDFGVVYKRHMSDMTRTVYIGKPGRRERKIYSLLLKSQMEAIRYIMADVKCSAPHFLASKILGKWDKNFIHGLGHGVGTKIHERPRIRKKSRMYLRENMAVTVEPGIYVKGKFGMRIEDTCLVRKDCCVQLTKSEKRLLVFPTPKE